MNAQTTGENRLSTSQAVTLEKIHPLIQQVFFELESIETLSLQTQQPERNNTRVLSDIYHYSQRGLNALHHLKNALEGV